MSLVQEVDVGTLPTEKFEEVLPAGAYDRFVEAAAKGRELLDGRVVWNINSTSRGGGVAEMLWSLIAYARGVGVDARWVVITGDPDFFRVTKRIHNNLHGAPGDGGDLGSEENAIYQRVTGSNFEELASMVSAGDVAIVHDPQPAGLVQPLIEAGVTVIWRCHVGIDQPNELARKAWNFLIPFVEPAAAYVFSRKAYQWERLHQERAIVIPPSIDAFSPKNQELAPEAVKAIMATAGLVQGLEGSGPPAYTRIDGTSAEVGRRAALVDGGPPPPAGVPLVVQVSRWDRLKDPVGVIRGFADHVAPVSDAHLIVAGPAVEAVSDDPEGAEVLEESRTAWEELPQEIRGRVHLAGLPMDDGEENAAMVNALQRSADVVVQKSLAEGFGLTVAEAMWKTRPVVATAVGGIVDQVIHGETGLLVEDPHDLEGFGAAVDRLLGDHAEAERLAQNGRRHIERRFLGDRHLLQYAELLTDLLVPRSPATDA